MSPLPRPLPAFSRASPSIRALPDLDPQLFKRGCALASLMPTVLPNAYSQVQFDV